jgi:hypothetical protein
MLTLDPNWVGGSPIDPTTLPEVIDRANIHGRPTYIPMQARPEYYNYKNGLRIPFEIPYTTQAVPVDEPYGPRYPVRYKGRPYLPSGPTGPVVDRYLPSGPTSPVVDHPTINDYRNMRATSPQMARTAPVNPRTYPVIESSRYLPTSTPSKFGWLKSGSKLLGPVGNAATVGSLGYAVGNAVNNYFGLSDKLIGNAGKGDLSELTRPTKVIKTPEQGSTYNGEISDAEFNSMSHQEKLNWLADRNQYRRDLAANYVPTSPTATNEYGEGKTPTGNVVLGSDAPTDAMLPDGTMIHDGVTVAPTVPTVDNLIATANKPRVANRVANKPQVTTPTTPTPTFNYGGSAPTYASSYNLNRDPNYQYSEAYAWRNNPTPTPTPWNNGWAKPNPRASSTTNYYAGIGY